MKLTLPFFSVGWLSFSLVFNILNTIIFSALYPKLLENIVGNDKSLSTYFSIINFITTLLSAIILPILGGFVDQAKLIKWSLIISQYIGIICTFGLFFIEFIPNKIVLLILNLGFYIFAMFFLRVSVMNNNALLPCFPSESITTLSLSANFIGFTTNCVGLVLLAFLSNRFPEKMLGISRESWWLIIFTSFSTFISIFVFLSPSGKSKIGEDEVPLESSNIFTLIKKTFYSLIETFRGYKKCWIYLLSYFFFSTTGTIITIYIVPLFIEIYKLSLDQVSLLNLYYKIAMVIGIFVGFLFDQFHIDDIVMLNIHNVLFQISVLILFLAIQFKMKYQVVLLIPLFIGCLYSWNISIARGYMSKIIPSEKKCEFMGFYSTFTYLGISIISIVNLILRQLQLPAHSLLIVVFLFTIPSYVFLRFAK